MSSNAPPDLAAFIERQRLLLAQERSAEIQRSSLLLSNCGPKLLEQKGLSLAGLGVVAVNVGLGGKTLVELERPTAYHTSSIFPPHTFRPGDLARIETNVTANSAQKKPKKTVASSETRSSEVEGVVYKISDTRIVIAVDPSDSSDDLDLPERCRVLKIANSVTYDRMDKAIDQLEKTATGSKSDDKNVPELTSLVQVLMAMTAISKKIPMKDIQFFDNNLNPSQKEAVKFCLESPEVACIHGPPGTGKTHTLIEIIRQLAVSSTSEKPRRLLVCGASNLSVDNILERLLALPVEDKAQRLKVTRIGHPARVMAQESVLDATLDVKAARTDQAALAKDVKSELEATLGILSGKGKSAKGKRPKGAERKKLWDEVKALRKEYRRREEGVVEAVLGESQIVLATCHSSGGRQLRNHIFDVVIIDEATQALEAVCWIPIFKAKKLILAGDPMQLPPTVLSVTKDSKTKTNKKAKHSATKKPADSKNKDGQKLKRETVADSESEETHSNSEEEEPTQAPVVASNKAPKIPSLKPPQTLETTLFDRLEKMYGPNIKRMLQVQYRMHSQICEFPSKTLYESKLESHDSVASHLLSDVVQAEGDEETIKEVLETPVVFFDTAGCEYFERLEGDGDEGSRCNENEATVVKQWIDKLTNMGVLASQIAVITPYQAQVTLLTSLLRPRYGSALEIGTVDGMQGREKDAVIISLVRSNDKREVGFLKEKRRLNVAMTRARRHLCVVGDSSTVRHGGRYLKNWLAWLDANADVRYAGLE